MFQTCIVTNTRPVEWIIPIFNGTNVLLLKEEEGEAQPRNIRPVKRIILIFYGINFPLRKEEQGEAQPRNTRPVEGIILFSMDLCTTFMFPIYYYTYTYYIHTYIQWLSGYKFLSLLIINRRPTSVVVKRLYFEYLTGELNNFQFVFLHYLIKDMGSRERLAV